MGLGLKERLAAAKTEEQEKQAAEKAKAEKEARGGELSAELEMLEASFSEAEKDMAEADEIIAEIGAAENLGGETAEILAEAKTAKDRFEQLKGELERVKAELGGAEGAEPAVEPAQAEEVTEAAPAEAAVEEKAEVPKTPEESVEVLNTLWEEISTAVKEAQEADFEKIENAEQKLSQLKSLRENILTAMNDAVEAYQSAGNLEKAKELLSQSTTAVRDLEIDDAMDMYARKANGLAKERRGGETQLQTEYSDKEASIIMKRLELDAKMVQGDNRDQEMWLLGNINGALGDFGNLSSNLSPEAIKIFEDKKNNILKNNIQQASHFDKLASESISDRIRAISSLDAREADAMAKVNRAIEMSKRDADKRRAE